MNHFLTSLDPRINRLGIAAQDPEASFATTSLDQFETWEVFQLFKEGKPFEHVGIVHAPDPDMAFLFGKEQFTRRGNACLGMAIARTRDILVSAVTDGGENILDQFKDIEAASEGTSWEIFFLKKRGKQHIHAGQVLASGADQALILASQSLYATPCVNVWVCPSSSILFSEDEDRDIWNTLPDKKYRDAIAYKAADKINAFKARQEQA